MTKLRTLLLATASVVALSGGSAFAAPYYAAPSWTGGYIGGEVGVARLNGSCTQIDPSYGYYGACTSYYGASSVAASATSGMGGVYLGYDWQVDRSFIFGAVADFDWAGLKSDPIGNASSSYGGYYTAKIDWLSSIRGRMGVTIDNNLIYMTGGLALADLKSYATVAYFADQSIGKLNTVQAGWVAGGGLEHRFAGNWSVKAEALYYDFGMTKADQASVVYSSTTYNYHTEFSHEVVAAKIGAAYHF